MEVLTKFTAVKDSKMIKEVKTIASNVLLETKTSFKSLKDTELKQSKEFLNTLAQQLVLEMHKQALSHYNAVIGEDMTQVLRYQKDSLITLQWNKLIILLFRVPLNPQGLNDRELAVDTMNKKKLIAKYKFQIMIIERMNFLKRVKLLYSIRRRGLLRRVRVK